MDSVLAACQGTGRREPSPSLHPMLLIAALVAASGALLHIFFGHAWINTSGHAWGTDDAYISYRYAWNAARGYGLVFNPGERVEGYSNLLFVLLLTPVAWLGSGALYPTALVVNILALAGLVLMVGSWLRRVGGLTAALVGAFGIAAFPPFWLAVASGLETPLVLLLQVAVVIGTVSVLRGPEPRPRTAMMVAAVLLVFLRPDGFIIPALAAMLLLASGAGAVALRLVLVLAAALAAVTAWRMTYYGLPLPMTYYVKVTGSLLQRLQGGFVQLRNEGFSWGVLPHLGIALVLGVVLAAGLVRQRRPPIAPGIHGALGFFGCAWLAYWFYIGGDVFSERFLLLVVVLSWCSLALLAQQRRAALLLAAMVLVLQESPLLHDGRFQYAAKRYDMWIETGRFLGSRYPGQLLAVDAAGKVPFFSDLRTVDILGLNDAHIGMKPAEFTIVGHSKTDPDYVLSRRPELVASWFANYDLDLTWGLKKPLYRSYGYCLRYMVQAERDPGKDPILDLWDGQPRDIMKLIQSGYIYAVLQQHGAEPCIAP